jgi:hypothetical protein
MSGTTGNGNTTQFAAGSGNAFNGQGTLDVGFVSQANADTPPSAVSPGQQLQSLRAGSAALFSSNSAPSGYQLQGSRGATVNLSVSNTTASGPPSSDQLLVNRAGAVSLSSLNSAASASQPQSPSGLSSTRPGNSTSNTGTPGRSGD